MDLDDLLIRYFGSADLENLDERVRSRLAGGLTVEIGNTDAEGRLILADALALALPTLSPATTWEETSGRSCMTDASSARRSMRPSR